MRSHSCQIVGSKQQDQSLFCMLNFLLQSRIETGQETTDDEDVNVYLANLLHAFLDRSFQNGQGRLASSYATEVARIADRNSLRHRYRVYRTNGDYALMTTSIFGRAPFGGPRRPSAGHETAVAERGSLFYRFAATLSERVNRSHRGVTVVLRKLSERFDTYVTILTRVRVGHLKLTSTLSDGEVYHLERQAQEAARPYLASEGRDRFLDAYSEWLKSRSLAARQKVNAMGAALSDIDPDFRFDPV